ncbi:hypothetical protein ADUPG1_012664 [Aduncisulcus paluster]|uniref:Uncharacterized protein n=1 Tax=Aduncisulcus paluster TaxID=2918883 RepID=A0ABQ5K082_9EUKA|nr:hypothetical protein ADUPG1_012664 [Aduncisulcus paluster]
MIVANAFAVANVVVAIWLVICAGILVGILAIYDYGYLCKQDNLKKSSFVNFVQNDGVTTYANMYDGTTDIALLDQTAGDIFIRTPQGSPATDSKYEEEKDAFGAYGPYTHLFARQRGDLDLEYKTGDKKANDFKDRIDEEWVKKNTTIVDGLWDETNGGTSVIEPKVPFFTKILGTCLTKREHYIVLDLTVAQKNWVVYPKAGYLYMARVIFQNLTLDRIDEEWVKKNTTIVDGLWDETNGGTSVIEPKVPFFTKILGTCLTKREHYIVLDLTVAQKNWVVYPKAGYLYMARVIFQNLTLVDINAIHLQSIGIEEGGALMIGMLGNSSVYFPFCMSDTADCTFYVQGAGNIDVYQFATLNGALANVFNTYTFNTTARATLTFEDGFLGDGGCLFAGDNIDVDDFEVDADVTGYSVMSTYYLCKDVAAAGDGLTITINASKKVTGKVQIVAYGTGAFTDDGVEDQFDIFNPDIMEADFFNDTWNDHVIDVKPKE